MKISVIVPTYRRPEYLKRCITALAKQTRKPDEVIVVVRDADKVSQEVVTQLQIELRKSLKMKVSSGHKSGQVPALNAGLNEARGDIICFTDDDAEPWGDWIERIEQHFRDPTIAGVGGRDIVIVDGEPIEGKCKVVGKMFWFGRYIGNHHLELQRDKPVAVDLLKGVNMAFRRRYLKDFHFDENLDRQTSSSNEVDLCFYIKRRGGRIIYDPKLKVNHYGAERFAGAGREEMAKNIRNYSHNYTYVILKNFPWYRKMAFLAYIFLVGQRSSWGLLTMLIDPLINGKIAWRGQVVPSLKGKMDGIKTYLRWRRDRQETSTG